MNPDTLRLASELPVVTALRNLSIFGPNQGAAYREHFSSVALTLGPDVKTKIGEYVSRWAGGESGLLILTGNAGTGKTAVAEGFCRSLFGWLPTNDGLVQVAPRAYLVKDLSGVARSLRLGEMSKATVLAADNQVMICANEGVLRDTLGADAGFSALLGKVSEALLRGAFQDQAVTVVNMNRQRVTGDAIWPALINFVGRTELWPGCDGCPSNHGGNCPLLDNATALRLARVSDSLRLIVRIASGSVTPNLREILSLLAWSIVGAPNRDADRELESGLGCQIVRERSKDRGPGSFDAKYAYFNNLLGAFLNDEAVERSPLIYELRRLAIGGIADLQVDEWLRDSTQAPISIRKLSGISESAESPMRSHLSFVETSDKPQTFEQFGDTLSTSDDEVKVDACRDALLNPLESPLTSWRRRVFFEGNAELGGASSALFRLGRLGFSEELMQMSRRASRGDGQHADLQVLTRALNALVTGIPSVAEGLILPESGSFFARTPSSLTKATPLIVHAQLPLSRMSLRVPDMGIVREILDVDDIELQLVIDDRSDLKLTISPNLYDALRQAELFAGPINTGENEMSELRYFYDSLVSLMPRDQLLRVVNSASHGANITSVQLPVIAQ